MLGLALYYCQRVCSGVHVHVSDLNLLSKFITGLRVYEIVVHLCFALKL